MNICLRVRRGMLGLMLPAVMLLVVLATPLECEAVISDPADTIQAQFEVHPDLEMTLLAEEPMLVNPTNIDVDHLGRVWVCEVLNYRHFRNTDAAPRKEGDRILVLEDSNGDGTVDKQTVFYQGIDIDSAHGVCVLGDRVIVSAGDKVQVLIDSDGDLKADQQEVLFSGIGGVQHDHGIHAFIFGPDGKLYFNFGNEGKQIRDKEGKPIIDMAGNEVASHRKPYHQGMVFRCNIDGSEFETLGWNFRNNWELAVDSFGQIWQSDNDDDGNRSTRINFVLPYGNYGYTDQATGAGWRTPRSNLETKTERRHWHQNDPGVVPNLLATGAGSPAGICMYEGDALPSVFHNQMIHCDPGPGVVRSYPVTKQGAGFTAKVVNIVKSKEGNANFRPSDVCVAANGSLIVADWHDPGVGGHRMQDTAKGKLYRISARTAGKSKETTGGMGSPNLGSPNLGSPNLSSPNQSVRFLEWQRLKESPEASLKELETLFASGNSRVRARALWAAGKLEIDRAKKIKWIGKALKDADPDVRIAAVNLSFQIRSELDEGYLEMLPVEDPAPEVRRAILSGLRAAWPKSSAKAWARLAEQYDGSDPWYLEAVGIAADGHWDECFDAWLNDFPERAFEPAGQDIVWRSRSSRTADLLKQFIVSPYTNADSVARLFRAFDFLEGSKAKSKELIFTSLAFDDHGFENEKKFKVLSEAVSRLDARKFTSEQKAGLNELIEQTRGTSTFIELVDKFAATKFYGELMAVAASQDDRQMAADAMRVLVAKDGGKVAEKFINADESTRVALADALVNSGARPADWLLGGIGKRTDLRAEVRQYALRRLGESKAGAGDMVWWIGQKESLDSVATSAISQALHQSKWPDMRAKAQELFPMAMSKDKRPIPVIAELVAREGDVARGRAVFAGAGTCAKCHVVAGQGIEVGPDLSEIGDKLAPAAMYESILYPSAGISHNYENWLVLTDEGQTFNGVLLGESADEVRIKDDKGIVHSIASDSVEEKKKLELSLMPADLHEHMTEQELIDLVRYLATLKKVSAP